MSSVGHRLTAIQTRAAGTCPVSRTRQPPAGRPQTARDSVPPTVYGTDPRRTLQHKARLAQPRCCHGARPMDSGRLPPWSTSLGCNPPLRWQKLTARTGWAKSAAPCSFADALKGGSTHVNTWRRKEVAGKFWDSPRRRVISEFVARSRGPRHESSGGKDARTFAHLATVPPLGSGGRSAGELVLAERGEAGCEAVEARAFTPSIYLWNS